MRGRMMERRARLWNIPSSPSTIILKLHEQHIYLESRKRRGKIEWLNGTFEAMFLKFPKKEFLQRRPRLSLPSKWFWF